MDNTAAEKATNRMSPEVRVEARFPSALRADLNERLAGLGRDELKQVLRRNAAAASAEEAIPAGRNYGLGRSERVYRELSHGQRPRPSIHLGRRSIVLDNLISARAEAHAGASGDHNASIDYVGRSHEAGKTSRTAAPPLGLRATRCGLSESSANLSAAGLESVMKRMSAFATTERLVGRHSSGLLVGVERCWARRQGWFTANVRTWQILLNKSFHRED